MNRACQIGLTPLHAACQRGWESCARLLLEAGADVEAKDNVKFLATLERHFKHILHGSLLQIIDTLPSMMNALRMVWVISRHYKEDHRMEPLMVRIAWEIANKISALINVRTIFRDSISNAIKLINDAQAVLTRWEKTYMDSPGGSLSKPCLTYAICLRNVAAAALVKKGHS